MGAHTAQRGADGDHIDDDDRALALRAGSGSLPAFCRIVERYDRRIFNFLLRRLPNRADAEDVTQETFLRAWQHMHRFNHRKELRPWLFTIAARLAANHLRRNASRAKTQSLANDGLAVSQQTPADVVSDRDEQRRLWDAAEALLPAKHVTLLWLRYAEQLSDRDIARIMGMTRIAVRVALHRSLNRLKEHCFATDCDAASHSPASNPLLPQVTT